QALAEVVAVRYRDADPEQPDPRRRAERVGLLLVEERLVGRQVVEHLLGLSEGLGLHEDADALLVLLERQVAAIHRGSEQFGQLGALGVADPQIAVAVRLESGHQRAPSRGGFDNERLLRSSSSSASSSPSPSSSLSSSPVIQVAMPTAARMPRGQAGQKFLTSPEATEESSQIVMVMHPTMIRGWNEEGTLRRIRAMAGSGRLPGASDRTAISPARSSGRSSKTRSS